MLKGHGEVNLAPDPHAAADMVLIRLAHVANMPTPGDLVKSSKISRQMRWLHRRQSQQHHPDNQRPE